MISVTKSLCGIDCWTDQQTQPAHSACAATTSNKVPKRLIVYELKQDSKSKPSSMISTADAMELTSDDLEENWTVFRDTVHSSAMDCLGPVSRKH